MDTPIFETWLRPCCLQVAGLALLAFGCSYQLNMRSLILYDVGQEADLTSLLFHSPPIVFCFIGFVVFLVAMFGCCSLNRKSRLLFVIIVR